MGSIDEATVEKREEVFRESVSRSVEDYQRLFDLGTDLEDARFVLPIRTKVNMVMSMNARMLMHVADMRVAEFPLILFRYIR